MPKLRLPLALEEEYEAQELAGRVDAGQPRDEGGSRKKMLAPTQRCALALV